MIRACAQRFPLAASAEFGPVGRSSTKLETGTSGIDVNDEVVMPPLMFVLPCRITRTPSPSSSRSRSGNAAPPCETRYAGPLRLPGRTGVVAVAVPTLEPTGQANGLAAYVASAHAFCIVVKREGSCRGSWVTTEWMFASWAPWLRLTLRLAPLSFDVLELDDTVNLGLNGSALQLATLKGLDRVCVALKVDVNVVLVASAPQLVGLKRKFGRFRDADASQPQRHALEDRRQRAGGDDATAVRVDADRDARDDRAQVESDHARPRRPSPQTVERFLQRLR